MDITEIIKQSAVNATNTLAIQAELKLPFEPSQMWSRLYFDQLQKGETEINAANKASEQYDELSLEEKSH